MADLSNEQVEKLIRGITDALHEKEGRRDEAALRSLIRKLVLEEMRAFFNQWTGTIDERIRDMIETGKLHIAITVNNEAQDGMEHGTTESN